MACACQDRQNGSLIRLCESVPLHASLARPCGSEIATLGHINFFLKHLYSCLNCPCFAIEFLDFLPSLSESPECFVIQWEVTGKDMHRFSVYSSYSLPKYHCWYDIMILTLCNIFVSFYPVYSRLMVHQPFHKYLPQLPPRTLIPPWHDLFIWFHLCYLFLSFFNFFYPFLFFSSTIFFQRFSTHWNLHGELKSLMLLSDFTVL